MNDQYNEIRICRICFENESEGKNLIAPCKCRGTAKYIHEECLNLWITEQTHLKIDVKCEVCKYKFQFEITKKSKCNPKESIRASPHRLCYFSISLMILGIVFILLYVVIDEKYIDYYKSAGYFIGVVIIFLLIVLCIFGIILKLLKGICIIEYRENFKVQPYKTDEIDLNNTTNMLNSVHRIESVGPEDNF